MNFFDNIHETQITRSYHQPVLAQGVPLHRRLFAIGKTPGEIARAAVREVLG